MRGFACSASSRGGVRSCVMVSGRDDASMGLRDPRRRCDVGCCSGHTCCQIQSYEADNYKYVPQHMKGRRRHQSRFSVRVSAEPVELLTGCVCVR